MLTTGFVFFRENVLPHTAACTRAVLEHFNWELSDHPTKVYDSIPLDHHQANIMQCTVVLSYIANMDPH
jgi:hypothetical protein